MSSHGMVQEDPDVLLGYFMDIQESHLSAIHSSRIDPGQCLDMVSLRDQVSIVSPGLPCFVLVVLCSHHPPPNITVVHR